MAHGKADQARRRRTATALRRRDNRAKRRRRQPGWAGHLPDLTQLPLAALESITDAGSQILRDALARIRRDAGDKGEVLAGFNSAL